LHVVDQIALTAILSLRERKMRPPGGEKICDRMKIARSIALA
jgi:hypothetical protein